MVLPIFQILRVMAFPSGLLRLSGHVNLKGVGRVYQQTFIDYTYAKVTCAKLYDRKTPITAADLLNDRVIPHEVKVLRMLTDRGS
jgi:hypothetical protein